MNVKQFLLYRMEKTSEDKELTKRLVSAKIPVPYKGKSPVSFSDKGVTISNKNKSVTLNPINRSVSGKVRSNLSPNLSIEGSGTLSKGYRQAGVSLKGKF